MRAHNSNTKTRTAQQTFYICEGSLEVRANMVNIYNTTESFVPIEAR